MNFDVDDLMTKIYENLSRDFTKKSIENFLEIYERELTKNDKETIDDFVQERVTEVMTKVDAIIVDSIMDLEFDIEDMKELEEFSRELELEDDLDQKTNTFGIPVEKEIESNIEEESELEWNEAE